MGIGGWLLGGPLGGLLEDAIFKTDSDNNDRLAASTITESEIYRINRLIEEGRKNGLSELELEISKNLADKFDASATIPLEAITLNIGCKVNVDSDGKCTLKIKYLPAEISDKIKQLSILHKDGILTDEEFIRAKGKLLKKI